MLDHQERKLRLLPVQRTRFSGLLHRLSRNVCDRRNFVVIGSDARAREVAEQVASNPARHMRNVGFLDDEPHRRDVEVLGRRYLGGRKT
jgi:FlaA1/EpsC-like NDP-sugar epimerase